MDETAPLRAGSGGLITEPLGTGETPPEMVSPPGLCHLALSCAETIVDEPKIVCDLHIEDVTGQVLYDGVAGIEIRGRTSQLYDKLNYGIELRQADGTTENPAPLLGMGKESDWILDGSWVDRSFMRNQLVSDLFEAFGDHRYGPEGRYCTLELNAQPQGIYRLVERPKRDDDRIDIAADDGTGRSFIIKQDEEGILTMPAGAEDSWALIYPKQSRATAEQIAGVQNWLDALHAARTGNGSGGGIFAYLDLDTTIDWVLIEELSKNVDAWKFSFHLFKDLEGTAHFVPWDHDLAFGQPIIEGETNERAEGWVFDRRDIIEELTAAPELHSRLGSRWRELRASELSEASIMARVDSYLEVLSPALADNFAVWPLEDVRYSHIYELFSLYEVSSYTEEVAFLRQWILDRLLWIDGRIDDYPD